MIYCEHHELLILRVQNSVLLQIQFPINLLTAIFITEHAMSQNLCIYSFELFNPRTGRGSYEETGNINFDIFIPSGFRHKFLSKKGNPGWIQSNRIFSRLGIRVPSRKKGLSAGAAGCNSRKIPEYRTARSQSMQLFQH